MLLLPQHFFQLMAHLVFEFGQALAAATLLFSARSATCSHCELRLIFLGVACRTAFLLWLLLLLWLLHLLLLLLRRCPTTSGDPPISAGQIGASRRNSIVGEVTTRGHLHWRGGDTCVC